MLDKTIEEYEEAARISIHIEEEKDAQVEVVSREPALDELLVLEINLSLTETVDYPLPRVIGD